MLRTIPKHIPDPPPPVIIPSLSYSLVFSLLFFSPSPLFVVFLFLLPRYSLFSASFTELFRLRFLYIVIISILRIYSYFPSVSSLELLPLCILFIVIPFLFPYFPYLLPLYSYFLYASSIVIPTMLPLYSYFLCASFHG